MATGCSASIIETSHEFEREIARGCEGIKPGWVRVNFNYFITEAVFEYVLDAVDLVATHGWRLLPFYRFDAVTGMWHHADGQPEPPMSLDDVRYDGGGMAFTGHHHHASESALTDYLDEARAVLAASPPAASSLDSGDAPLDVGEDFEHLRWFWLPEEIATRA